MMPAIALVALTCFIGQAGGQGAGDARAGDTRAAEAFLAALHRAILRGDRRAVAGMIQYPITVRVGSLRIPLRDAAALVQSYESIFTDDLEAAIAGAAARRGRDGSPSGPEATRGGFVIDGGALRITPVAGTLKITAITVPGAGRSGGPASAGGGPPRPGGGKDGPHRIVLRAGQHSTEIAGAIAPGATDAYVVHAGKGRLLDVRVAGVKGREVIARVLAGRTGTPLDVRAGEGARTWTGRVQEAGDYRIEIVRPGTGEPAALAYTLVVSIK